MRSALVGRWVLAGFTVAFFTQVSARAQANRGALDSQQASAALVSQHPVNPTTADTQHVIGANSDTPKGVAVAKTPGTTGGQTRITSEKDFPHIRYPLHESASSLVAAENAEFNSFLSHYAPDLNTLLTSFSIESKPLLLRLLETQEDAAILAGDRKAAETALAKQRDLGTTSEEKALLVLSDVAFLHAWKKAGAENGDAFEKAYADEYAHRVNSLPWDKVEGEVKTMAAQCGSSQPTADLEYVRLHLDPEAAAIHAVMLGEADRIVLARKELQFDRPTQAPRCAILNAYLSSHQ